MDEQAGWLPEQHQALLGFEGFCHAQNVRRFPARAGRKSRGGRFTRPLRQEFEPRFRFAVFQDAQRFERGRIAGAVLGGSIVEHAASADGGDGRELPDDEAVAGHEQAGFRQAKLHKAGRSRFHFFAFQQDDPRQHLRRPAVEMHLRMVLQRPGAGQKGQGAIEGCGGLEQAGRGQHHAAGNLPGLHSRQIQSRSLACGGAVGGGVVDLDAAHARALSQAGRSQPRLPFPPCRRSASR